MILGGRFRLEWFAGRSLPSGRMRDASGDGADLLGLFLGAVEQVLRLVQQVVAIEPGRRRVTGREARDGGLKGLPRSATVPRHSVAGC